jgi:hypothetical protein
MSTGIIAYADEQTRSDKVMSQMEGAVEYLTKDATSYGVDDAIEYYNYVASGVDTSKFDDAFIKDVKANLDANSGKIVSSYGESLATYGAVILTLSALGEDVTDFYGYDITKAFSAMDPTGYNNEYYYRVIIPATLYCDDDDFAKAICDHFVDTTYVMGKGMAMYGQYFGCDNTAYFITALSTYATDYPEVMKDAFNVLESYKVDGGYVYDTAYGTDPNADSTALALMAYCSVFFDVDDDDYDAYVEKVNGIYDDLCAFEGSTTGVFQYYGEDNAYATSDALKGLEEYYLIAFIQDFDFDLDPDDEEELTTTPTTKNETTTKKSETTTKKNTSKTSPQTGASTGAIALSVALAGAGLTLFALKKKEQ